MKYATAGQRFVICVRDTNGLVTGDAANLTCQLSIDGGTRVDLTTNTATPIYESDGVTETGYYSFPASTAEVTGHELSITPVSSTSGNECFGIPGNVIYTSLEHLIQAKTDLIGGTSTTVSTESVEVTVDSTETVSITCDRDVSALTLSAIVQTKGLTAWTTVATVVDASIAKTTTIAAFAMTSAMTSTAGTKRIIVTNAADSDVVASPLLFVTERLP